MWVSVTHLVRRGNSSTDSVEGFIVLPHCVAALSLVAGLRYPAFALAASIYHLSVLNDTLLL